jgi:hypothetical protein
MYDSPFIYMFVILLYCYITVLLLQHVKILWVINGQFLHKFVKIVTQQKLDKRILLLQFINYKHSILWNSVGMKLC